MEQPPQATAVHLRLKKLNDQDEGAYAMVDKLQAQGDMLIGNNCPQAHREGKLSQEQLAPVKAMKLRWSVSDSTDVYGERPYKTQVSEFKEYMHGEVTNASALEHRHKKQMSWDQNPLIWPGQSQPAALD